MENEVFAGIYEYNRFEADMEFRKARIRTLFRSLFGSRARGEGAAALSTDQSADLTADNAQAMVPISSIVGVMDREGRAKRGFPRLGRRLADQWRRDFLDHEAGAAPFTVQQGAGGWYLMGGVSASVLLETLKAKNQKLVRIVRWTPKVLEVQPGCDSMPCAASETASVRAAS